MSNSGIDPTIMVALITGSFSIIALSANTIINSRRDRKIRQREEFSKAFAACVSYEEFPYIVRRRRSSASEDERIRISTELSQTQKEIAYYSAWLSCESREVSVAYENLVANLRGIVGSKIKEAWQAQPILSDAGMNMPDLGLGSLKPYKQAYLNEVSRCLSWCPKIRR